MRVRVRQVAGLKGELKGEREKSKGLLSRLARHRAPVEEAARRRSWRRGCVRRRAPPFAAG